MDTIRSRTADTDTRFLVDAVREIEHPLATTADLEPLMEKSATLIMCCWAKPPTVHRITISGGPA